jgi:hypothetical protein
MTAFYLKQKKRRLEFRVSSFGTATIAPEHHPERIGRNARALLKHS